MSELWDAYDINFKKIDGVSLVRGQPIIDGIYHLVCEIIVKHIDGTYLLMKRDLNKTKGGKWELSAGGSVLKGETSLIGAIRELKEETGIDAKNIEEIKTIQSHVRHAYFVEFLCITDCKKDSIVLQQGETIDYKWLDKESLLSINRDELASKRTMKLIKELGI